MMSMRAEALLKGHSRYTTGKRCKRGHLSDRYAINGECCECVAYYKINQCRPPNKANRERPKKKAPNKVQVDWSHLTDLQVQRWYFMIDQIKKGKSFVFGSKTMACKTKPLQEGYVNGANIRKSERPYAVVGSIEGRT